MTMTDRERELHDALEGLLVALSWLDYTKSSNDTEPTDRLRMARKSAEATLMKAGQR